MNLKNLLSFILALAILFPAFASVGSSTPNCGDNDYALLHPQECSQAVGCADNDYALSHPVECGEAVGCADNDYALAHPEECGQPVGCSDNDYALSHPVECGEAVGCADNDYALAHPEECGQPVGCSDNDYALAHPVECGEAVGCADNDYALLHPVECGQPVGCTEKFIDNYRCSPNGFDRQREKLFADCTKQWVTIETCTFGCQKVFADPSVPVSCFSPPADVPPQQPVVDNLPHVSIDVPASAAPGAQLGIAVTGTDDIDVRELNLFNSNNVKIASFDCVGIQATCSATFLVNAPATPNTAYTFRARSKDSVNQESGFVSDSGVTTAALAVPLPAVSRAAAVPQVQRVVPRPLQDITVRFPLQPLFMRSLSFPDSDCVKPGESALLAVKVQNTGRAILKDVVFSAFVPELDLRSRIGPLKMASDDKLPRFLGIDVPENAPEGTYLLRFTVNNNRFTRAVHRSFVISGSC